METLAAGKLDSLPTGAVYIRMIRFAQPVGYVINSKQHVASFVYVETGSHRLVLSGQSPIDLSTGQATFHQSVTHQHLNPGPQPSVWYSIAIWPSSARGQALVDPIARAAYESEDVSPDAFSRVDTMSLKAQMIGVVSPSSIKSRVIDSITSRSSLLSPRTMYGFWSSTNRVG